jgi:hypothetical protein
LQPGVEGFTVFSGENMAHMSTVGRLSRLLQAEAVSSTHLQEKWRLICSDFNSWVVATGYEERRATASTAVPQTLTLSSHLSKAISTLLNAIISLLTDFKAILDETDSQFCDDRASSDNGDALEETRLELVEDSISDLHALIPALLNPAPHDAITDARYASISISQTLDQNHLDAKFPGAESVLRQRLSRLNWSRRVLRTSSQVKAEQPQQGISNPLAPPIGLVEQSPVTVPPSIQSPPSAGAATTILPPQTMLSTDPSTLQSAQSLFEQPQQDLESQSSVGSMTSYAATTRQTDDKTIPIPYPPRGCLEGLPFQCTICFRRIHDVKTKRRWKRHVFRDLRPYVCTFGGCWTQDVMYDSRREWFKHEIKAHRSRLPCFPPCQQSFEREDDFYHHLCESHSAGISIEQTRLLCELRWSRTTLPDELVECPLCDDEAFTNPAKLEKHLGGHLEQIALFVLPRQDRTTDENDSSGGDDDDSEDSEEQNSTKATIASGREMDFSEKMNLFDRPDSCAGSDGGQQPVYVPDHVAKGLPYCRRTGKPAVMWDSQVWDPRRPFICTSQCGETFDSRSKWLAHEQLNFPKDWWVCKLCSEGFPRRDRLRDHKKKIHGDPSIVAVERRDVPFPVDFSQRCNFGCTDVFFNDLSTFLDHFQEHIRSSVAEFQKISSGEDNSDGETAILQDVRATPASDTKDTSQKSRAQSRYSTGADASLIAPNSTVTENARVRSREVPEVLSATEQERVDRKMHDDTIQEERSSEVAGRSQTKQLESTDATFLGPDPAATETRDVESKVLRQFREFADIERQKLQERKRAQELQDRPSKLNDLLQFSRSFKLSSPVPNDLIGILAKDPQKQEAIGRRNKEIAEESTPEQPETRPRAFKSGMFVKGRPLQRSPFESYGKGVLAPNDGFTPPLRKNRAIVVKDTAGRVVNFRPPPIDTHVDVVRTSQAMHPPEPSSAQPSDGPALTNTSQESKPVVRFPGSEPIVRPAPPQAPISPPPQPRPVVRLPPKNVEDARQHAPPAPTPSSNTPGNHDNRPPNIQFGSFRK